MAGSIIQSQGIGREGQRFILNDREIPGIQDVQVNYEQSINPLIYAGINVQPLMVLDGLQVGKVSISSLLVTQDFFLPFTGTSGFDGLIIDSRPRLSVGGRTEPQKMSSSIGFISGYLTNYNSSCSIGDFPKVNADIIVLGDIGLLDRMNHPIAATHWFKTRYNDPLDYKYKIADSSSINITLDNLNLNRILSYEISIDTQRQPLYVPGLRVPIAVEPIKPSTVQCTFSIEPDIWWLDTDIQDYKMTFLRGYPANAVKRNITISLNDNETSTPLTTYAFTNMELLSENYVTSIIIT